LSRSLGRKMRPDNIEQQPTKRQPDDRAGHRSPPAANFLGGANGTPA
jgi:hypothetical protein